MDQFYDRIISHIKQKKEYVNLDNTLATQKLDEIFRKQPKLRTQLSAVDPAKLEKNKDYKALIKKIRKELREIYGVFILNDYKKMHTFLDELKVDTENEDVIRKILSLHQSSKERLEHYEEIFQKIFAITGNPKSILELGCGLNPFSYDMLGCKPTYTASDLNAKDLEPIAEFFKKRKIEGDTIPLNLVKEHEKLKILPRVDCCFLFKLLDSLETEHWDISKTILENINADHLIVSFPTKSLGGKKPIKKERRGWFEKILSEKGWKYSTFEVENEVFYVIKK
jgi:16S rRNA (guanine(1405)-N(7))-methyltransferase